MPRLNMTVFCTKAKIVAVTATTNIMLIKYGQLSKKNRQKREHELSVFRRGELVARRAIRKLASESATVKSELAHEEAAVAHGTAALRAFHEFDAKTADLLNQLLQLQRRPYLCRRRLLAKRIGCLS